MQFIKIGNRLINLANVIETDLQAAYSKWDTHLSRDYLSELERKGESREIQRYDVMIITLGTEGSEHGERWSRTIYFTDVEAEALRWFFTDWLPYVVQPLLPCIDVLKQYEQKIERERRQRKEFKVGDEVWHVKDAATPGDTTVYVIDRIEDDLVWLHPQGEDTFADSSCRIENLQFADI